MDHLPAQVEQAQRDAQVLRGEGDNQAFRIIAEATGRDADGRSALEIARDNGNAPLAELLARSLPAAR